MDMKKEGYPFMLVKKMLLIYKSIYKKNTAEKSSNRTKD